MAEYIEREAAEKVASKYGCSNGSVIGRHSGLADCIANDIAKLPAADVVLVRHGKWDDIPNMYMSVASKNGSYSGNVTSCSICHEINPNAYRTNYCPNCGAKMDLEESR